MPPNVNSTAYKPYFTHPVYTETLELHLQQWHQTVITGEVHRQICVFITDTN